MEEELPDGATWFHARAGYIREALGIPMVFEGERELLESRRRLIAETVRHDDRAFRLAEWLRANRELRSVVVFVDDREVADLVAKTLEDCVASGSILRYVGESELVRRFEASEGLTVLVCDGDFEEGLNLQRSGATIIHYDLPLEPARLEQRIGRVDRIEARGRLRNVAFSAPYPYEREWFACLSESIRIFNRSVAPLQYVLAEATAQIRTQLLSEGPGAIEQEATRLADPKAGLDNELRRIQAQEALDSIEGNQDQDAEFFEALVARDESISDGGQDALESWLVERLQFGRQRLGPNIVRYSHDSRRPTLLPLLDAAARFGTSVDRQAFRNARFGLPFLPVTFDRVIAETKHVGLLRVGHPFVAALEALMRSDDRGTAFAVWRYAPRFADTPQIFLRFDFVIQADVAAVYDSIASVITSKEAVRRRADDAFPVEYRTVWLTSDLDEVKDPKLSAILGLPYTKGCRPNGGRDVNLRPERWDRAVTLVSFGDWPDFCARARRAGEQLIRTDAAFRKQCTTFAARTRESAVAVANAFSSRIARLSGAARQSEQQMAQFELRLSEALACGIETPSMRVDSAGVMVLSPIPLETE
jgi:ATP-dependent helicase HepA